MDSTKVLQIVGGILVVLILIPVLPKIFKVLESPDPQMNAKNLVILKDNIKAYGKATGYYPATLEDLAPEYMA
jgi:hypothetical protein